jgi:hypothetical protein
MASCFGSGSFVASDGMTAQIPQVWADAFNWYYAAMWTQHFAPTGDYIATSLLNKGATISSGRIAMSASWVSQINSYGSAGGAAFSGWDMGVMPSWKGQTTSPLGIDTFTILKAIMADPTLMQVYGGEPARTADQAAWFESMDAAQAAIFPGNLVTWSVLQEMEKYPANPSPEADMPNVAQSNSDVSYFVSKLQNTSGLNIQTELTRLQATLQTDWDSSPVLQF